MELVVQDGAPEGAVPPDLDAEPQLTSPVGTDPSDLDPEMLEEYAKKIFGAGIKEDLKKRKDSAPTRKSSKH